MKHIGVLGAGIQGSCVALELAQRGYQVDLLDKNEIPVSQASLHNEGKIHLGFVYAADSTLRTASLMLEESLRFGALLNRWCDFDDLRDHLSTPFFYAVHAQSQLSPAQIERHFAAVNDLHTEMTRGGLPAYLGLPDKVVCEKPCCPIRGLLGAAKPSSTARAPWMMAEFMSITCDGEAGRDLYDHVVNCLWDGRLAVDDAYGLQPTENWLYRFKLAITVDLARSAGSLASTTILLGPFGDVVSFANAGKLYLSWYPSCMQAMTPHPPPPDWRPDASDFHAADILPRTLAALANIHGGLRTVSPEEILAGTIGGGVICARGSTDIDDPISGLHKRLKIGVRSYGSYHSLDTGKYCMAPYFAEEVGRRIAGETK